MSKCLSTSKAWINKQRLGLEGEKRCQSHYPQNCNRIQKIPPPQYLLHQEFPCIKLLHDHHIHKQAELLEIHMYEVIVFGKTLRNVNVIPFGDFSITKFSTFEDSLIYLSIAVIIFSIAYFRNTSRFFFLFFTSWRILSEALYRYPWCFTLLKCNFIVKHGQLR